VNAAKQSVAATSDAAKEQISKSTSASTAEVKQTVEHAKSTMATNLQQADKQSESLNSAMNQMRVETKSFESSMGDSRRQLNEAKKLQPEMTSMRKDLQDAVAQIRKQQEVISSSEEFVKQVFSSHQIDIFHVGTETKTRLTTIGPPAGGDGSVVLLVLSSTPIRETLQVQYRVFTQPPDSYVTIHNLLIFFWGEHLANLNGQELSASYFPDKSDTEHINALSEHDGRVFADKEPLPYFNKPDPTFKGNRWFKSAAEAPAQKRRWRPEPRPPVRRLLLVIEGKRQRSSPAPAAHFPRAADRRST
jgi:hypothetical protein